MFPNSANGHNRLCVTCIFRSYLIKEVQSSDITVIEINKLRTISFQKKKKKERETSVVIFSVKNDF